MLRIGAARGEITAYEPRLGMMGWGMLRNVVERVGTPLHARAFVLTDAHGDTQVVCICELAFITLALRQAVIDRLAADHPDLGLDFASVLLQGTHTHSGPGGFTHYAFYNVTIPGFSATVLDELARKIVATIAAAAARREPATIRYGEATFEAEIEVAFNRAVASYNCNPDVDPVSAAHSHLAVDRTLRLVRFDADDGRPLGSLNWFSVHCTSVHSDNTALHFDNKGYAAKFVEEALAGDGHRDYVAAFAQGAPGDVTPNFRRYPDKRWLRGKFADDDESARWNGRAQADKALEALETAERAEPMTPRVLRSHAFVDFSDIGVDPQFVDGRTGLRTAPAEIGMAMFFGTEEGPGLPRQLVFLQKWIAALRPHWRRLRAGKHGAEIQAHEETQAEKIPWVESGRRRFFGLRPAANLPVWNLHPALRVLRTMFADDPEGKPWTPAVLPVHLVVLGDVALCAVGAEFTTVAARRLCAGVEADLHGLGVRTAVLAGYANAYAGYVVTPQEYELQDYEGASTHFGKWTLPAYQTEFRRLTTALVEDRPAAQTATPPTFSPAEVRLFPA
jgi:neutral ceramidase